MAQYLSPKALEILLNRKIFEFDSNLKLQSIEFENILYEQVIRYNYVFKGSPLQFTLNGDFIEQLKYDFRAEIINRKRIERIHFSHYLIEKVIVEIKNLIKKKETDLQFTQ